MSLYALISRLDKTQVEPFLIVPERYPLIEKFAPWVTAIDVVPSVRVVKFPAPAALPAWLAANAADAQKIKQIIRNRRIDIVHNNVESCWLVGMVARQMGIPSIAHIRGLTSINTPARAQIVPRAMQLTADQFTAVSKPVKDAFVNVGIPESIMHVIDNAADIAQFHPEQDRTFLRTQFGIAADVPLIGVVGAADSRKGWIYLVMACALIREQFPTMKCVFVGDDGRMGSGSELFNGVDRYIDAIHGLVRSLQLENTIVFAGPQSNMPAIYASLDVLVQPSLIEAGPRAIVEGMASGVPVVATRVGGSADYVTHGHDGLLVPVADAGALAAAVNQILADPAFRQTLAIHARQTAEARFSLTVHARRFEQVYASLHRTRG